MEQPSSPRKIKVETLRELIAALRFYASEGHYRINGPGSGDVDGIGMSYRESAIGIDTGDRARAALELLEKEK